jgi:hypothetical protein
MNETGHSLCFPIASKANDPCLFDNILKLLKKTGRSHYLLPVFKNGELQTIHHLQYKQEAQ